MVIHQGMMGEIDDDPKLPANIWVKKFSKVSNMCKEINVFKVGKNYYKGYFIYAVKEFMESDLPVSRFKEWVSKNYKKVTI